VARIMTKRADTIGFSGTDDLLPTRQSLLRRLKDWDDDHGWQDFFDTYWELIYNVARKSGLSPAEAEEVVQETIICVAKDIQKFKRDRQRGSFKGWLRNLTRWRIADQLRKRTAAAAGLNPGGDPARSPVGSANEPEDENAVADWDREWQGNLLKAAMDRVKGRVNEEQYQLFDFCVIKEWPVTRITTMLGVSPARVYLARHRISRLIEKEVRRLEREWERG
jgi:RNA polymerase sigma-70 factor (ECF subfamily)